MVILGVCCYSTAYVQEAKRCGANRIKLCAAPQEGGLAPPYGVLIPAHGAITSPVHPIARPRGGDSCYTEGESAAMPSDICMARELGFPGVMIGVLSADSRVDIPRIERIMAAAGPLAVTFHHAFDLRTDPRQAWKALGELGVKRILTSGRQSSTEKGISSITELIAAGDTLVVMAGAGVRTVNLPLLLRAGVREVHSSAGQ